MGDRDIRAHLRGAVKAGVIDGWYFYGSPGNLRWVVNAARRAETYDHAGIVTYCGMLREAGVDPIYILARA